MNNPTHDSQEKNRLIAMVVENSNTIVNLLASSRQEIVNALHDITLTRDQIIQRYIPPHILHKYSKLCCQRAITQIAREEGVDNAHQKKVYHGMKGRMVWDQQVALLGEQGAKRLARERSQEYARKAGVIPYSDEEKSYIIHRKQESGPMVGANDMIAQECNRLFHEDKPIRNGTTLGKKYAKWKSKDQL